MSAKPLSEAEVVECLSDADPATKGFIMQQTMYRIKDPKATLKFYTGVLGMTLLSKCEVEAMKFTVYFVGYENKDDIPKGTDLEKLKWTFTRSGTIELVHNWGSENDDNVKYHNGNTDPRGFGHIGISVPDIEAACQRFETLGVPFVKKLHEGKMKGIAFIKDPDGYWIEVVSPNVDIALPTA